MTDTTDGMPSGQPPYFHPDCTCKPEGHPDGERRCVMPWVHHSVDCPAGRVLAWRFAPARLQAEAER